MNKNGFSYTHTHTHTCVRKSIFIVEQINKFFSSIYMYFSFHFLYTTYIYTYSHTQYSILVFNCSCEANNYYFSAYIKNVEIILFSFNGILLLYQVYFSSYNINYFLLRLKYFVNMGKNNKFSPVIFSLLSISTNISFELML